MENTQSNNTVRPWQGTALGVWNIIGLVLFGLIIALILISFAGGLTLLEQIQGVDIPGLKIVTLLGAFILVPLIPIFILVFFITKGVFKGKKWAIIVSIIFTVLAILQYISDFKLNTSIIWLAVNGFMLWAEIVCIRHPFYNHK